MHVKVSIFIFKFTLNLNFMQVYLSFQFSPLVVEPELVTWCQSMDLNHMNHFRQLWIIFMCINVNIFQLQANGTCTKTTKLEY